MSKPDRHQQVKTLFLAACQMAPEARPSFLADACGDDVELRREIESLLDHDDDSGAVWSPEIRLQGGDRAASLTQVKRPERIGRFAIIDVLGEGGMGTVYLAEQEHPKRSVALKVIKSGVATPQVLRRFEHEVHVLGRLHHPGIAQVYEAGIAETDAGPQPYFAMELVQGETLNRYAESRGLDMRERLRLLASI